MDAKIAEQCAAFADAAHRLDEIHGVATRSAEELIAEIGVDMSAFPTAAHLVSWAKFAPIDRQSARDQEGRLDRQGEPLAGGDPRRGRRGAVPH